LGLDDENASPALSGLVPCSLLAYESETRR
jgi:hypothetical protein